MSRRPTGVWKNRAVWALAGLIGGVGAALQLAGAGPRPFVSVLFGLAALTGIAKSGTC